MKEVPDHLRNDRNQMALNFLANKGCHGDIVEPLAAILKDYHQVKFFCPDPYGFKYCFWYVDDIIFAVGFGMSSMYFRLPGLDQPISDLVPIGQLGTDWYSIPFDSEHLMALVDHALNSINQHLVTQTQKDLNT